MGNQNGNGKPRPAVALAMEHAREELSQSEYLVLIAIASYADPDGWAWPSYSAIGHRARVSEATVKRAIRGLEKAGELEVHSRASGRRTNAYVVVAAQTTRVTMDDPSGLTGLRSKEAGLGSNGSSTRVTMDDLRSPSLEDQTDRRGDDPHSSTIVESISENGNVNGLALKEGGRGSDAFGSFLAEVERHLAEEKRRYTFGANGKNADGMYPREVRAFERRKRELRDLEAMASLEAA